MTKTLLCGALVAALATACGPGRTTYARFPGAAPTFDRAHSDPKAVEIADRVVATAGGPHWTTAKQLKWHETISSDGKVALDFDEAWDRWNGRHYGRLHRDDADIVVMRGLYEGAGNAYAGKKSLKPIGEPDSTKAIDEAKKRFQFDTAVLCMPFLLEEPGTKLEYVGDAQGETPADDLKVTFDPTDTTRSGTWHVIVDRSSNQIVRLEYVKAGAPDTERIGYALSGFMDVGGMKMPTKLQNIGLAGETIAIKDITAGEPDDSLYVPQVQ